MPTVSDVAQLAECSTTLVSRVLNNQKGVSPKSREKIIRAINQLGYTPNAHARSLVTKKTNTVGVVVDTLCEPFYFDLIRSIDEMMDKSHYKSLYCSGSNNYEKKEKYINFFMQERCDGIILYGSFLQDMKLIGKLQKAKFPFVLIELDAECDDINNILLDNKLGSKIAVDYLYEHGCRSIYHVAGDANMQASQHRQLGFINAVKRHGMNEQDARILNSGWSEDEGYETIREYLRTNRTLPDAFYFSSDQTAFGGMHALQEAGVSIPDEVQIIGFDDDKPRTIRDGYMQLTTLHQPLYEMGYSAVNILLKNIEKKNSVKRKMVFDPKLIVRQTTK